MKERRKKASRGNLAQAIQIALTNCRERMTHPQIAFGSLLQKNYLIDEILIGVAART
jgi:hypothetical protein